MLISVKSEGVGSLSLEEIRNRYISALMGARKIPFWRRWRAVKLAEREAEQRLLSLGWPLDAVRLILRDARDIAGLDS